MNYIQGSIERKITPRNEKKEKDKLLLNTNLLYVEEIEAK